MKTEKEKYDFAQRVKRFADFFDEKEKYLELRDAREEGTIGKEKQIIINMLKNNIDINTIKLATGKSVEDIEIIKKEYC